MGDGSSSRDSGWFSVPEIVTVLDPSDTNAPGGSTHYLLRPPLCVLGAVWGEGTSLRFPRVAAGTFDQNTVVFFSMITPRWWRWGHRCPAPSPHPDRRAFGLCHPARCPVLCRGWGKTPDQLAPDTGQATVSSVRLRLEAPCVIPTN